VTPPPDQQLRKARTMLEILTPARPGPYKPFMSLIAVRLASLFILSLTASLLSTVAISTTGSITTPVETAVSDTSATGAEVLTADELAAGWRLLFDGVSTQGWRGFRQPAFPSRGWIVEDRMLKKVGGVRGGDIVTTETFEDFELSWEWWIPPGANNGIKYFIVEERGRAVGHEYQMIDDSRVRDPKQQTASFYDVLPPHPDREPPRIGEWNHSLIRVHGEQVEHWLNGMMVLSYTLGSPEVLSAVAKSKFHDVAGFGTKVQGHILLTDHTDEARFRRIMIR
jgi:hypothetical protein